MIHTRNECKEFQQKKKDSEEANDDIGSLEHNAHGNQAERKSKKWEQQRRRRRF